MDSGKLKAKDVDQYVKGDTNTQIDRYLEEVKAYLDIEEKGAILPLQEILGMITG